MNLIQTDVAKGSYARFSKKIKICDRLRVWRFNRSTKTMEFFMYRIKLVLTGKYIVVKEIEYWLLFDLIFIKHIIFIDNRTVENKYQIHIHFR
jgi:uncharacterized protein YybS (DUF2232 family)